MKSDPIDLDGLHRRVDSKYRRYADRGEATANGQLLLIRVGVLRRLLADFDELKDQANEAE